MRKFRNSIYRLLPFIALVALIMVGAALLYLKFKPKEDVLVIDETANIVTEIRKISELTTACYYEDVILKDKKAASSVAGKVVNSFGKKNEPIMEDEIVIVASGNVRAGFDLSKLTTKDVVVSDSLLEVTLPKAEILDVIVNPSNFDIYIEDGHWTHEQVTKVEDRAMNRIRQDAVNDGLLQHATKLGVARLTEMFKTFGYSEVVVKVRK